MHKLINISTAPNEHLTDFMKKTQYLELSAQQLFNDSVNFFRVLIEGQNHTIASGPDGLSVNPSVQCPSGTVKLDVFCGKHYYYNVFKNEIKFKHIKYFSSQNKIVDIYFHCFLSQIHIQIKDVI